MKYVFWILLVLLGVAALSIGYARSGLFNVSAMQQDNALVYWLLSTTRRASVARRARDVTVPALDDEALQLAGINDFDAMCVGCHGAPGREPGPMGQGLNPRPPSLRESASHLDEREIFWVTKHGIRMTGMPAWGSTHDDASLWPVVAFIRLLPTLDEASYESMLDRAEGTGHHAPGSDPAGTPGTVRGGASVHDEASHPRRPEKSEAAPTGPPASEPADDHSNHDHEH